MQINQPARYPMPRWHDWLAHMLRDKRRFVTGTVQRLLSRNNSEKAVSRNYVSLTKRHCEERRNLYTCKSTNRRAIQCRVGVTGWRTCYDLSAGFDWHSSAIASFLAMT